MAFLSDPVIIIGETGTLFVDNEQWCGLLNTGMMPEMDESGRLVPGYEWKQRYYSALFDDDALPLTLSPEQARIFAEALERYSAGIPEKEEIGKVLSIIDREVDGVWKKFIVTTRKGWLETSDVELPFVVDGKEIIHKALELLRAGSVTVELASDINEAGW